MAFDFSNIMSGIGKVLDKPIVQQGIGLGIDYLAKDRAQDATTGVINQGVQQGRPNPYNVFSGFGNLTREGNNLSFGGGVSDQLMGLGSSVLSQYNPDPQAAAQQRYQMLTDLALPQENRSFQRLKDNLFASGRAGTTGGLVTGDDSLRAFQESSNTADLQRQLAGQDFAQAQNANLYNQGTGFLNSAFAPFASLANASLGAGAASNAAPSAIAAQTGQYGNAQQGNAAQYGAIADILKGGLSWLGNRQQVPSDGSMYSM